MTTILIVEDELDLAELVAFNLEREGFNTVKAHDGIAGLQQARTLSPDLILLDLMLPGMPGVELCRHLKTAEITSRIPVIMLTALGEVGDRVAGFQAGADDYVAKPFSTRELLLRVKAVLRRSVKPLPARSILTIGPLVIDAGLHRVLLEGAELQLTAMEFKLLHVMAKRAGTVQSRAELLRDVWGYSYVDDSRTVDTHLTRLRTKLGKAGEMIKTVRGFGYLLAES